MVCLDTSVLVAILRKDKLALQKLEEQSELDTSDISTTTINLCELYAGAYRSRDVQKELDRVTDLKNILRVLELNEGASRRYGELANSQVIRKNPIGDFDLIISSIAMEFDESLATRNKEHFARVPGLRLETW